MQQSNSTMWILGGVGLLAVLVLMMRGSSGGGNAIQPTSAQTVGTTNPQINETVPAGAGGPGLPVSTHTFAYDLTALPSPTEPGISTTPMMGPNGMITGLWQNPATGQVFGF